MTRTIESVHALARRYKLFVFDPYGVLHDGQVSYPGMLDSLRALKAAGKKIAVLSNSGRRANVNAERLARFGYDAQLIDHVITSGEIAWRWLAGEASSKLDALTLNDDSRILLISRGGDTSAVDGLPGELTSDPAQATMILISGSQGERISLEQYREHLVPAARRSVPALCTNPDKIMLLGDDRTTFGPGRIADVYSEFGAPVTRIGKPFGSIYETLFKETGFTASKTLCIGDSIEHDIVGASKAGCASVLVSTGIHAELSPEERDSLCRWYRVTPDYLLDASRSGSSSS